MSKLTEAGVIKALNNQSWLYEGLKKNVRHEERPPYHQDVEDDIIPDNVNDYEDSEDFWLDDGFGYRCPNCKSAFVSPEQIGEYEKVECPYCETIIHPESIDEELNEYEIDNDDEDKEEDDLSSEDEDGDTEIDIDEDEDDEDDDELLDASTEEIEEAISDFTDQELANIITNLERENLSENYNKARARKKANRIRQILDKRRKNTQYNDIKQQMNDSPEGKKLAKIYDGRPKSGKMSQNKVTQAARIKRKPRFVKLRNRLKRLAVVKTTDNQISKKLAPMRDNWSNIKLLQMDEQAVMAVLNETISKAFASNRDCIPFEVTDITKGSYKPSTDTLTLEALITYEDGVEDTAEFVLEGIKSGEFELTETTGAFDFDQYQIIGNSSIVNESIIIN